ncbi:hypothetical protein EDD21DRAFT_419358 [Dissophora ornata]|nr:hypothetical protein EDD21DRAFT_419358 [Dissophora ornata]
MDAIHAFDPQLVGSPFTFHSRSLYHRDQTCSVNGFGDAFVCPRNYHCISDTACAYDNDGNNGNGSGDAGYWWGIGVGGIMIMVLLVMFFVWRRHQHESTLQPAAAVRQGPLGREPESRMPGRQDQYSYHIAMEDLREEESTRYHSEIGALGEAAPAYEQFACCSAVPCPLSVVPSNPPRSGTPRAGHEMRRETWMEVEVEVEVVYAVEGQSSSSDTAGCSSLAVEGAPPEYAPPSRGLYVPRSLPRKG